MGLQGIIGGVPVVHYTTTATISNTNNNKEELTTGNGTATLRVKAEAQQQIATNSCCWPLTCCSNSYNNNM
ncbi:unnamed protein product [Ceratitis capitata]|uniref:(Mediterranean fruit fly) hypothetical protein n=1 Tax=Ceratitis capitata TaxID=7213 RepID=A0A811VG16_CERCA|nr:unnamed protein product [Ceratitis capitata]